MKNIILMSLFCLCISSECKIFDCQETDITFIKGFYEKCLERKDVCKKECNRQLMEDFTLFCTVNKKDRLFSIKEKKNG